jgi:hypothetical protein
MRRVLAAALVVLTLAGCSTPTATARDITEAEADRVADVLFTNYDSKGADFEINAIGRENKPLSITGEIDFVNGAGRALVQSQGTDSAVVEVAWLGPTIVERLPVLTELAAARGETVTWVSRSSDTDTYDLDRVIGVLIGLASEVRENPLLLRQGGMQWLRSDSLRGTTVDVFQFGASTRLWVEHDSSRMLRFEGNNDSGTAPIVVDLLKPGERTINLPTLDETVTIDSVSDLYEVARARG